VQLAVRLFGGHITRRAEHGTGIRFARQAPSAAGLILRRGRLRAADLFSDAPVHHQHLSEGSEHDVLRLEVAVQDASGVGEGDGVADLPEQMQPLR